MRASGYAFDQDSSNTNAGVQEKGYGIALGVQKSISDDWRVGFSIGYEEADADFSEIAFADIQRIQLGVSSKYLKGAYTLSMAVTGGHSSFDTTRIISLPSDVLFAQSGNSQQHITSKIVNKYTLDRTDYYIAPVLELDISYIRRGDINEAGAGALNQSIASSDEVLFSATPSLEIGKWFGDGASRWKAFAKVGGQVNANTEFTVQARFEGAPVTVAPLLVVNEFDRWAGVYEVGVELPITSRIDMRLGVNGRVSADSTLYSGAGKIRLNF